MKFLNTCMMLSAKTPTYCGIYLESIQVWNELNHRKFSDKLTGKSSKYHAIHAVVSMTDIALCHLHSNGRHR